uniref:hypothetical protein n=1 Tax=uncultured Allobacillus sp. TaxID=1638025 RepID=UPI0025945AC6|nr:hypothetical protein [uncultured Allobacillus sp.]
MNWLISQTDKRFQLNISSYSSIFVNHSSNEQAMIGSLIQYFQPRSKVKDLVKIMDIMNDYEEVSTHSHYAHMLSNDLLLQETQLGAKTVLKSSIKSNLGNHMETEGYLLTINTLVEDLIEKTLDDLPIKYKSLNIDSLIKSLYVDLTEQNTYTNYYLHQSKSLVEFLVNQLRKDYKKPIILIYNFPESYLSPKEQLEMKDILIGISESVKVLVITKSLIFLADEFNGLNYFLNEKQIITECLLDDLEWECPVDYEREDIKESLIRQFGQFANYFELNPTISNSRLAEINVFSSLDLYVLVNLLDRLRFQYNLDLDENKVVEPVMNYVKHIKGVV